MSFFRAALRGANVSGKIEEAFGALKDILGYSRDGSQIAERLSDIPSAREVAGFPVVPPAGLTTGVKSVQPNVLSQHQSEGFMSDELIPPARIAIGRFPIHRCPRPRLCRRYRANKK